MKIIKLKLSVTNDYLIGTDDKYILIDTGYVEDYDLFCKRLEEAKVTLNDISHIILTHHHDDHCGLINKIVEQNKDIKVVMTSKTRKLLLMGENDTTHGGGLLNKRISALIKLKKSYISVRTGKTIDKNDNLKFPPYKFRENDIIIKEGTTLKDIGIDLNGKIIETPGHTIDSISIIFDDGSCFVGDAAANFLRFAGTKYCVVFVMDLKQYYKSWRKILENGAKKIYPAHGRPFDAIKLEINIDQNKQKDIVLNK